MNPPAQKLWELSTWQGHSTTENAAPFFLFFSDQNRPFSLVHFVFPIILRRIGPLFCSLKRAHASVNMPACTLFNEQKKGQNILSISTWSVLGKQNVQAKKVYYLSIMAYSMGHKDVTCFPQTSTSTNREFKKPRRQLQGKRHIKIELCVKLSLLRLFHVDHVVQIRRTALSLAWYEWFSCKGKEWKIYCCELPLWSEPQIW